MLAMPSEPVPPPEELSSNELGPWSLLLATLSHELRAPLEPVLMAATCFGQDESLRADVREAFQMIARQVTLQARLLGDLLDLARLGRPGLALPSEPTDLHALLREVVAGCRAAAQQKGQRLTTRLRARMPVVAGDPVRLGQVFSNLLRNAVKFTPAGGRITVRSRNGPDGLVMEVQDSGIGIARESLAEIFRPFAQGSPEVAQRFGGLGLGLAIAEKIVLGHGGTISAQSPGPGRGATFRVVLPVAGADASNAA
jgi:signal transduction histidine kinase